jgi:hypothetical protein
METNGVWRRLSRRMRPGLLSAALVLVPAGVALAMSLAPAPTAPPAPQAPEGTPVLVFYVTRSGIEPDETEAKAGTNIVVIRNGSGLDALEFSVTRKPEGAPSPEGVYAGTVKLAEDIVTTVNLVPGDLDVVETTHPELSCHVTVVP